MKRLDTGDIVEVTTDFEPKIGTWFRRMDGVVEVFVEFEKIEQ